MAGSEQTTLTATEREEYNDLVDYLDECDHPWKVPDPAKAERFYALREKLNNGC